MANKAAKNETGAKARQRNATPTADSEATAPESPQPQSVRRRKRPHIPAPAALTTLKAVLSELRSLRETREPTVLCTLLKRDEDGHLQPHKNKALFAYEDA